jgi:hypothetical protein
MKINILFMSACLLFMASACTVNKRAHRPGYNVEWHSANPKPQKHPKIEENVELGKAEVIEGVQINTSNEVVSSEGELAITDTLNSSLQEEGLIAGNSDLDLVIGNYHKSTFKIGQRERIDQDQFEQSTSNSIDNAHGLAITGFVLGLVGLFFPFLGPVAIVFSGIRLSMIRKNSGAYQSSPKVPNTLYWIFVIAVVAYLLTAITVLAIMGP